MLNKSTPKQPRRRVPPAPTSGASEEFHTSDILKELGAAGPPMLWSLYAVEEPQQHQQQQRPIDDTELLLSARCTDVARDYMTSICPVGEKERQAVCQSTLGPHPTWKREKIGRMGASMFRRIIRCTRSESIVQDILYPRAQSMKPGDPRLYGIQNEPGAVSLHVSSMAAQGRDVVVEETWPRVHREYPYTGVSRDRIVRERGERGLLEVKCPSS